MKKADTLAHLVTNQTSHMPPIDDHDQYLHFGHFKAGKEEGFTFFYHLYYPALNRRGQRCISDHCAVEELVHDAFLATWQLRHLVESPKHLYCFIRLRVKWGCCEYLKRQRTGKHVYYDNMDEQFADDLYSHVNYNDNKELVALIYKALPALPPNKKNVVLLHFRYGLSCKEIARHYCTSCQRVTRQLHDSIIYLKSVLRKKKKPATEIVSANRTLLQKRGKEEVLKDQQWHLFRLRYEQHYSFDRIASELGLPVAEVQQQYITAHRMMRATQHNKQYSYG